MSSSGLLKSLSKRTVLAGALVLIFLLAVSFSIRKNDFNKTTGVQNLEATYHALLTIKALRASPIENHWFLPTVTLGQNRDKNISWGATVPTKTGDYVYTSFTPAGFLAPYIAFGAFKTEVSEKNIARFNFILGSLVSLVLYALLVKVLEQYGYGRRIAVAGAVLGTTISIFSKEVLQSHGLVYWSHSFYQLILISGLYLLFAHLNSNSAQNGSKQNYSAYLIAAVFFGAWTEWTGYVFGVGLAILFWFGILSDRPQRGLSIKLVIAVAAAGLLTLIHYGFAVGFEPAIKAFIGRFLARNTASGSMLGLLNGYALSFGLYILIAFAAVALPIFLGNRNKNESLAAQKSVAFLFFAATIPLLENFIMLQHAGQFSFDRLKLLFPAAIIISIFFARQSNVWRVVLAISLVFAAIQGYSSYRADLSRYDSWHQVDSKNKALANSIINSTDIGCSVLLSNIGVRGYSNLLLNRGIYEYKSKDDSSELIDKTQACSAIYLEGEWSFSDLPYYKRALITKADESSFSLVSLEIGTISPDFFLTDLNWHNGIARHWSGFFVPNTDSLKAQLIKGSDLIFQNGAIRKITDVKASGNYLNVYVDGPPLNATHIGPPTLYFIRSPLASSP